MLRSCWMILYIKVSSSMLKDSFLPLQFISCCSLLLNCLKIPNAVDYLASFSAVNKLEDFLWTPQERQGEASWRFVILQVTPLTLKYRHTTSNLSAIIYLWRNPCFCWNLFLLVPKKNGQKADFLRFARNKEIQIYLHKPPMKQQEPRNF